MSAPDLEIHLTDLDTGTVNKVSHWQEYNIVDDLMKPASRFTATLAAIEPQRSFTAHGGQKAQVFSYGALQITAITDERTEAVGVGGTDLQIAGRGVGGLLLDSVCPADKLTMTNRTLFDVANRITAPWQPDIITSVITDNAANRYMVAGQAPKYVTRAKTTQTLQPDGSYKVKREDVKVKVGGSREPFGKASPEYRGISTDRLNQNRIKPEETVATVLSTLCKQIACHWFVGADGSLIIMRPQYDLDASVYGEGIVQKWDKKQFMATGGNVMRSKLETSIASRHSEIVAWGKGKTKKTDTGKQLAKHVSVKDPSTAFWMRLPSPPYLGRNVLYKPKRIVFKNLQNEKVIRRRCRTEMETALIGGFSLEYQIAGHTINGVMPVVDSMINVHDERYGLTGAPYYITRVQRRMDMNDGKTTVIKLIPPKIWLYVDHDSMSDSAYLEHMAQRVFW